MLTGISLKNNSGIDLFFKKSKIAHEQIRKGGSNFILDKKIIDQILNDIGLEHIEGFEEEEERKAS